MPNVLIRDLDDHVYAALKQQAKREGRSLNKEIVHRLSRGIEPKAEPADPFELFPDWQVDTLEAIQKQKREGLR